jgi:hypothetical protein
MKKYFLLDLDDFHPEKGCGLELDRGPIKYLELLWSNFPELKVTLFLTPDWRYLPQFRITKFFGKYFGISPFFRQLKEPKYRVDKKEFREWRSWIRKNVKAKRLEVAIHGLYHIQPCYHYASEFQHLNYNQCLKRIKIAEKILEDAKIPFVKGFRPPGWLHNEDLLKALSKLKYKYFAAGDKLEFDEKYNLLKIPVNCDIKETKFSEVKNILKKTDYLFFHGHVNEYYRGEKIGNGLTEESYSNLVGLLRKLKNLKFIFHSDLVSMIL